MRSVNPVKTPPGATVHPAQHAVDAPGLRAIRKLGIERLSGSAQAKYGVMQGSIVRGLNTLWGRCPRRKPRRNEHEASHEASRESLEWSQSPPSFRRTVGTVIANRVLDPQGKVLADLGQRPRSTLR